MIELGTGQEAGVAADVGDDEAGRFRLTEHVAGIPRRATIIDGPAVGVTGFCAREFASDRLAG